MKVRLLYLCLLASALALTVRCKPHGKHEPHREQSQSSKEKSSPVVHDGNGATLPTFFPFEASSPEPEDEAEPADSSDGDERATPVLLSEEALTKLLQASEDEQQQAVEEDKEDEDEGKEEERELKEAKEEIREESKVNGGEGGTKEVVEELGSSTDSEIPVDLDYAADGEAGVEPLPTKLEDSEPSDIKAVEEQKVEKMDNELPTAMEDYDSQQPSATDDQETKESSQEQQSDEPLPTETPKDEQMETFQDMDRDQNTADEDNTLPNEKEVETNANKGKGRKQKKSQRQRNMQSDQPPMAEGPSEHDQTQEKEPESSEGALQKAKRRKNGKWSSLVGINPVQIRATVELFPRPRPVVRAALGADGQEAPADPCENFRCKRGKTCKLNEEKKPTCVCQDPAECPPGFTEFDHVCGTDNQTYDTSCQLFATKCGLEGTKKGHRLHLDYTGSCKFIPPCLSSELLQFPLRMRDWLKNVLLQLYEHDSVTPGFLTAKQRLRVQKLYESERRLHAGHHSIELLAQDFEKNYHMYIYPVHWQFAQMDQHPSDRFLTHSELSPLRVPLVPMEHCTSVFFQECDADKDKLVSFREWCQCFGIKDEDMDTKLLF
ncbi:SPARC-like protein 1 isoform X1 [Astyanax mexicanus]|uniref:SPARC-like protein 1 isoform X1 n=1 Tax=Astyanax mexicanus TaxID=7994 RepID=UPI0020CB5051|nr:SPARC-like protein 1 isoform X1 [Astyanax mexicanus]